MINLEASAFLNELSVTVVVDSAPISAIVDGVEQKRHEVSGLMVETMQLTAVALDFGPATVGQLLDVAGVEWEVEAVRRESSLVVVSLTRNLG